MSKQNMQLLATGNFVTGFNCKESSMSTQTADCVPCVKGKPSRLPFTRSENVRANEVLQLIHSDLCGPMENTSLGGARYFLTFIDDYSRKVFVYTLENKNQVKKTFESFKELVENQTGKRIKILRTDNGTEYINRDMSSFLEKSGIRHETSVEYTPEQNGLAERMNRTILERARSMLIGANLPKKYWGEAVSTGVYLINRSPASALPKITPEEAWCGLKPDVSHLKVFGCKAMTHVPKQKRLKWDSKSTECVFLGYCESSKAYRLLQLNSGKLIKARDVVFFENELAFPLKNIHREHSVADEDISNVTNDIGYVIDDETKSQSLLDSEEHEEPSDTEIVLSLDHVVRRSQRGHIPKKMD